MTINATTVYRVRAGGNDVNGGGYDSAISGVIATTLNGSLSSGATTVVVASASGWPSSGNYYARIGAVGAETISSGATGSSETVLVTGGQGTTSWTVTRGQLGTTAQAFATGIVVDNNLSQCDTASFTGTVGTSTAATTFTDAAGAFNATVVGNTLWLASGTGTTVSAYAVTGFTNATTITLDRASGTYTLGVWKIGGAWANVQTNVSGTYVKPGNTIYVRGAGVNTPNAASPTYTHATASMPNGNETTGFVTVSGENGRPTLKGSTNTVMTLGINGKTMNLCFAGATTSATAVVKGAGNNYGYNLCFDQNGFDQTLFDGNFNSAFTLESCEFFNSGSAPAAANPAILINNNGNYIIGCNIHDVTSVGIQCAGAACAVIGNVLANCGSNALTFDSGSSLKLVVNNTFDGGAADGIKFITAAGSIAETVIFSNIFSNFSQAGKFAINGSFNATSLNDSDKFQIDYNAFYNNTANYNNITAGTHDTALSVSPYVAQSTQNFTLTPAAAALLAAAGYPGLFPQSGSGKTTTVQAYVTPGAVTPQAGIAGLKFNSSLAGGMAQ